VLVNLADGIVEVAFIDIGDGHHPAIALAEERGQVVPAHPADADEAHDDLLGGSVVPEQPGRDEHRHGSRASRHL